MNWRRSCRVVTRRTSIIETPMGTRVNAVYQRHEAIQGAIVTHSVIPTQGANRLRVSEWIIVVYLGYLVGLLPFRSISRLSGVKLLVLAIAGIAVVASTAWWPDTPTAWAARTWLPIPFILPCYWLTGLYFVDPQPEYEARFAAFDNRARRWLGATQFVERAPRGVLEFLELSYFGCYIVVVLGMAMLYLGGRPQAADRYAEHRAAGRTHVLRRAAVDQDEAAMEPPAGRPVRGAVRPDAPFQSPVSADNVHARQYVSERPRGGSAGDRAGRRHRLAAGRSRVLPDGPEHHGGLGVRRIPLRRRRDHRRRDRGGRVGACHADWRREPVGRVPL